MNAMTKTGTLPSVDMRRTIARVKDPGSAITHFIGLCFAILMQPVLLIHAAAKGADATAMMALSAFMTGSILLYGASTAYHTFRLAPAANRRLKKLDHCMISVLIAGTYTPVCLIALRDSGGIPLLIAVAALSFCSVVFKLFRVSCPRWLSSVIYLILGWLCLLALPQMLHVLPGGAFALLLSGGLAYSVGAVVYALKLPLFNARHRYFGSHEIFHVFVMAGNFCHFLLMYCYLSGFPSA